MNHDGYNGNYKNDWNNGPRLRCFPYIHRKSGAPSHDGPYLKYHKGGCDQQQPRRPDSRKLPAGHHLTFTNCDQSVAIPR